MSLKEYINESCTDKYLVTRCGKDYYLYKVISFIDNNDNKCQVNIQGVGVVTVPKDAMVLDQEVVTKLSLNKLNYIN